MKCIAMMSFLIAFPRSVRIGYWGEITQIGEEGPRILRVDTLNDGETVHNAFFDRGFRRKTK